MWVVRLALRRPYTFTVAAALILILGLAAIVTTAKDIFPAIDIPVVSVVWSSRACPRKTWRSASSPSPSGP